jgi:hypothetical protein
VKKGNSAVPQVHVKWQGLPDTATSWEDWYVLKAKFPEAAASGQAESQAGGGGVWELSRTAVVESWCAWVGRVSVG